MLYLFAIQTMQNLCIFVEKRRQAGHAGKYGSTLGHTADPNKKQGGRPKRTKADKARARLGRRVGVSLKCNFKFHKVQSIARAGSQPKRGKYV